MVTWSGMINGQISNISKFTFFFFLGLRCTFEPPDANVDVMRQKLNQKSKGA
jgi:hypothetical protein